MDACYALVVDELAVEGVARAQIVEQLEKTLGEPTPDEVSADELERLRRRKIADENRAATERLAAMSGMPVQRREG